MDHEKVYLMLNRNRYVLNFPSDHVLRNQYYNIAFLMFDIAEINLHTVRDLIKLQTRLEKKPFF